MRGCHRFQACVFKPSFASQGLHVYILGVADAGGLNYPIALETASSHESATCQKARLSMPYHETLSTSTGRSL